MSDKVAMPGDPDEVGDKLSQVKPRTVRKSPVEEKPRVQDEPQYKDKGEGSRAADAKANADTAKEVEARDEAQANVTKDKGPFSSAQHDDDGWGDTPVQMRGE